MMYRTAKHAMIALASVQSVPAKGNPSATATSGESHKIIATQITA
jgi:hypothetical protein